jgi:hypothetical protein
MVRDTLPSTTDVSIDPASMRVFVVPPDQVLPALSTEVGERPYTFAHFMTEWVWAAKQLREDDNLESAFALDGWLGAQKDLSPGTTLSMPDDIWATAKLCAKASIDEAMTPGPVGAKLPMPWAFRILRMYHVLARASTDAG